MKKNKKKQKTNRQNNNSNNNNNWSDRNKLIVNFGPRHIQKLIYFMSFICIEFLFLSC